MIEGDFDLGYESFAPNEGQVNYNFDDIRFECNEKNVDFDLCNEISFYPNDTDDISPDIYAVDSIKSEREKHLSLIDAYNQTAFEKACAKKAEEEAEKNGDKVDKSSSNKMRFLFDKNEEMLKLLEEEQKKLQEED